MRNSSNSAKNSEGPGDGSKPLDPKREKFVAHLLNGDSAAEAYRKEYPRASKATAETNGPLIARETQVSVRLSFLQTKAAEAAVERHILTDIEAKQLASEFAKDSETEKKDRISAMKLLGKWMKWETGTQAEHKAAEAVQDIRSAIKALTHDRSATA